MSSNLHKRKSGFMEDLYIGVVKIDQKITFRLKFQFHALFFFQICRDECEILEYRLCQKELAIARSQPLISHQLVLPDCMELPVLRTPDSHDCVRLGMPNINTLIKPHSCFQEDGTDYRGKFLHI